MNIFQVQYTEKKYPKTLKYFPCQVAAHSKRSLAF